MIANDDPGELLLDYGWHADARVIWTLVHQKCLVSIRDVDGGMPRSLFEACSVGALDGSMDPVQFPTVVGDVRWVARHTIESLRARGGKGVRDWETR